MIARELEEGEISSESGDDHDSNLPFVTAVQRSHSESEFEEVFDNSQTPARPRWHIPTTSFLHPQRDEVLLWS
jgi:hypothetical protein